MMPFGGVGRERTAAALLLAVGLGVSSWMHDEAIRAAAAVKTREQQLEHLVTLSRPGDRRRVAARSLESLEGLFRGQSVVWLDSVAGPVLSLSLSCEGGAR